MDKNEDRVTITLKINEVERNLKVGQKRACWMLSDVPPT